MIRTILRNTINNTDKFRGPVLKNFHISAITRLKESKFFININKI